MYILYHIYTLHMRIYFQVPIPSIIKTDKQYLTILMPLLEFIFA